MSSEALADREGERDLVALARDLGGRTLGEIAARTGRPLPPDPKRHKGAAGSLIERALGVVAVSAPGPDFAELGIELKTLPIDARGQPAESTFVCCAPRTLETEWESSSVRKKLARVLWVPIETSPPFASRRVGSAFVWSPDPELEDVLRADWQELGELVLHGPELVSARHGRALQLRPKGRDGSVRVRASDADGAPVLAPPRAYYLRRWVTHRILVQQGLSPAS